MISLGQALARIGFANGDGWAPLPWPNDDPWNVIYEGCESPIERLMCLGIHGYLGYDAGVGRFQGRSSIPDRRAGALVYGQHWIGRYRADFLVVGFLRGEEPVKIVVECDGKEFHDNHRDRLRDRVMGDLGFEVVRFTGFEINRRLAETIGRIPTRMGKRYAWTIAAECGQAVITDMTDSLDGEGPKPPAKPDFRCDDGSPGKWSDTL